MIEIRQAGPFANDGERRVAGTFRSRLTPGAILITNLFLPDRQDTLEIDLVAITPLGVFVVEVK
ncbi:MAG: NERD domain-containing protein, partial [Acidimicrobiia bacterium]|nr:NERD domain-containing protein [Acidimicrobiia bacterium]